MGVLPASPQRGIDFKKVDNAFIKFMISIGAAKMREAVLAAIGLL